MPTCFWYHVSPSFHIPPLKKKKRKEEKKKEKSWQRQHKTRLFSLLLLLCFSRSTNRRTPPSLPSPPSLRIRAPGNAGRAVSPLTVPHLRRLARGTLLALRCFSRCPHVPRDVSDLHANGYYGKLFVAAAVGAASPRARRPLAGRHTQGAHTHMDV